jgi:gliding motility-associated-like protein
MHPARIVIFFLLLHVFLPAEGQPCLPNQGFEDGTYGSWEFGLGGVAEFPARQNAIWMNSTGPNIPFYHDLVGSGVDRFGGFPRVCPYGGRYSLGLGLRGDMDEAERATYNFVVPNQSNFIFTTFYSVVMKNQEHEDYQQPRFIIRTTDLTTNEELPCGSLTLIPGSSGMTGGEMRYMDWSMLSIHLGDRIGHRIAVEFTVADCTHTGPSCGFGGCFAYAYIDVYNNCTPLKANAPICAGSNVLALSAPPGYAVYAWHGPGGQIISYERETNVSPVPLAGTEYWVEMWPMNGACRDTMRAVVSVQPVPDTPVVPQTLFYYCRDMRATALQATAKPEHVLQWYGPVGLVHNIYRPPLPETFFADTTIYYVLQKSMIGGCQSPLVKITVIVLDSVPITFSVDKPKQCLEGNRFTFTNTTWSPGTPRYNWSFGDGGGSATTVPNSAVSHSYTGPGIYPVSLKLTGVGSCSRSATYPVVVIGKPDPRFEVPGGFCFGQASVHLHDTTQVPGSTVNSWWWQVNGTVYSGSPDVRLTVPPNLQTLPVLLAVSTPEGCKSDTVLRVLGRHDRPVADFSFIARCENVPVQLFDRSAMPSGSGSDQVAGWQWLADRQAFSQQQHPTILLRAGQRLLQLVARSNEGCFSDTLSRIVPLEAAPDLFITYDDSCAGRPIHFTANDRHGLAGAFRWNFGTGFFAGTAREERNFLQARRHPVELMALSPQGCPDTVRADVRLYRLQAGAGRDTLAAKGEPVQLHAGGDSGTHYSWSPATGLSDPSAADPVATLDLDQRYTLYAIDSLGCDGRSEILLRRYVGPELYVPNAFTPNSDGRNDVLRVISVGIRDFHYLAIYDRWGGLVFRSTDRAQGWNGNLKGQESGSGTYVWIAEGTDYTGRKLLRKGTVTIVR